MPKKVTDYPLLPLVRKFINESKKGKRLQKNGKKLKKLTIANYSLLEEALTDFCILKKFNLRVKPFISINKKEFEAEKKYWKDFYHQYTGYLYDERGYYDNAVGTQMRMLRAVFNYLNSEKGLNIGSFHKNFFVPSEEIGIVVISPERLNFLITSKEFHDKLPDNLKRMKDFFVFGCTVALRYSDLCNLTWENIEETGESTYLSVQSKKTGVFTKVKLPVYAVEIINKNKGLSKNKILPFYTKPILGKGFKRIGELAGWTEPATKVRHKRGIPVRIIPFNNEFKQHRFCDQLSTHTMRRSGITTMLSLGMKEQMVRKISGHAANSKEFHKYVAFVQPYIDKEIDMVHEKLAKI